MFSQQVEQPRVFAFCEWSAFLNFCEIRVNSLLECSSPFGLASPALRSYINVVAAEEAVL